MAAIWFGLSANAAEALKIASHHVAVSDEQMRVISRLRYHEQFGANFHADHIEHTLSAEKNFLVGSVAEDSDIVDAIELAERLPVTLIALCLQKKPKEGDMFDGWSKHSQELLWESLGGPSSTSSILLLMLKGDGHEPRLKKVLECAVSNNAKKWKPFKLDPKSAKSTLKLIPKPASADPGQAHPAEAKPEQADSAEADPREAGDDKSSNKKNGPSKVVASSYEQLMTAAVSQSDDAPWFISTAGGKKRRVSASPPDFKSRATILARLRSDVYQLGPNELGSILGWDFNEVNVHLLSPTLQTSVLAATPAKPIAEILLAAAMDVISLKRK